VYLEVCVSCFNVAYNRKSTIRIESELMDESLGVSYLRKQLSDSDDAMTLADLDQVVELPDSCRPVVT
jgi:hypothetical protein